LNRGCVLADRLRLVTAGAPREVLPRTSRPIMMIQRSNTLFTLTRYPPCVFHGRLNGTNVSSQLAMSSCSLSLLTKTPAQLPHRAECPTRPAFGGDDQRRGAKRRRETRDSDTTINGCKRVSNIPASREHRVSSVAFVNLRLTSLRLGAATVCKSAFSH